MRLLSIIMLSLLVAACDQRQAPPVQSDAEIQKKLAGRWVFVETNGNQFRIFTTVIAPDGGYFAEGAVTVSSETRKFSEAGTMLVRGGLLIQTATKHSDTNARLPFIDKTRIVRLDGRELVLQDEEHPDLGEWTIRKEK